VKIEPPKEGVTDKVLTAIKATIDAAPVGSIVTYLLDQIIKPPLLTRTEKWMENVSSLLNEHVREIETLNGNQRFVTAFLQASQIAGRNHSEVKLIALRNAVVNSIDVPGYEEVLQVHFLHLVDRFTEWHLNVLKIFYDTNWLANSGIGPFGHGRTATEDAIKKYYPDELGWGREVFVDLILYDLEATRLIQTEWNSNNSMALNQAASTPSLTTMGLAFLDFIGNPKSNV
jgi:hypothetical protein